MVITAQQFFFPSEHAARIIVEVTQRVLRVPNIEGETPFSETDLIVLDAAGINLA